VGRDVGVEAGRCGLLTGRLRLARIREGIPIRRELHMESARAEYVVDRVDAEGYEPDVIDGTQVGEFHQIEPAGGSAEQLDACLWRSGPGTYDYQFENDEAFHVVEGTATIQLPDTDERIDLRAGDIGYFTAGTRSIWTITEPFKKFTVIAK
jgi:uncharacterized cupin superfamily protein